MDAASAAAAPSKRFKTFEELASLVDRNRGVFTIMMEELRNAYGAGKLGVHIRTGMSDKLRSLGLDHLPEELPLFQEGKARIYRKGSPVGKLIEAVTRLSEDQDQILREAAGGDDTVVIQKIRELVCS
jgi:hypothetical protein